MDTRRDHLFGQIAVGLGLITRAQLEEALATQAADAVKRPLGLILVLQGTLDDEQMNQVLAHQLKKKRKEDHLLAKRIVAEGVLAGDQVEPLLAEQARRRQEGDLVRLGDLCVEEGLVSRERIDELLGIQAGTIVICDLCLTQYNVPRDREPSRLVCPRCKLPLLVPEGAGVASAPAAPAMRGEVASAPADPPPPPPKPKQPARQEPKGKPRPEPKPPGDAGVWDDVEEWKPS